jgi:hypothetical protein
MATEERVVASRESITTGVSQNGAARTEWEPPTVARIGTFGESLFGGSKNSASDTGHANGKLT